MEILWTKLAPRCAGLYWVKMPGSDKAEIVEVFVGFRKTQFYRTGDEEAYDMDNPMFWGIEPIERPF